MLSSSVFLLSQNPRVQAQALLMSPLKPHQMDILEVRINMWDLFLNSKSFSLLAHKLWLKEKTKVRLILVNFLNSERLENKRQITRAADCDNFKNVHSQNFYGSSTC